MAKTRTKKPAIPPKIHAIDPVRVHELLGIPGPCDHWDVDG
jgi:hypothetical protein